ncbi:MAG: protein-methionine-sulfoxide reductase catalytic subunit MsrP [Betaproteobacteria bacterium AqS2]|uniref:Protein-methionine-sulfoxide reductase catalytic subunit MsrP n=1 Tax=Candidatus Amphirhobacter heronislandensis TaxID=1732024 RepID=A0A930UG47_9GAMM|nr:protein-methionine-sulfoxide reductase catalytic subunit MsrP [Betaproteobacteria bacterium AqS2]
MKKIPPSAITPEEVYLGRRRLMAGMAGLGAAGALGLLPAPAAANAAPLAAAPWPGSLTGVEPTPELSAISYNNFYELGTRKESPRDNAGLYEAKPWTVRVDGAVAKPGEYGLEDLLGLAALEERIYRLRCVEAWSMVIPWIGYPLARLIEKVEPLGDAKYVAFETFNPEELFPNAANRSLPWPYREGLRLDEASHDLTLLAFGMYGKEMLNQNGAPVRIVVPWKYGYKSIKAIVRISFVEEEPRTSWNMSQPSEYGFYSNVNPEVDHPRWSQASERLIGDSFFPMFNGYADEVAGMYAGMDLRINH